MPWQFVSNDVAQTPLNLGTALILIQVTVPQGCSQIKFVVRE
jgi:hypothetical protein